MIPPGGPPGAAARDTLRGKVSNYNAADEMSMFLKFSLSLDCCVPCGRHPNAGTCFSSDACARRTRFQGDYRLHLMHNPSLHLLRRDRKKKGGLLEESETISVGGGGNEGAPRHDGRGGNTQRAGRCADPHGLRHSPSLATPRAMDRKNTKRAGRRAHGHTGCVTRRHSPLRARKRRAAHRHTIKGGVARCRREPR